MICRIKSAAIIFAIIFILSVFFLTPAYADDFTSTNFISRDPVMSIFGGRATSTGFEQFNAGGQTAIGEATGTNFILRAGFLYFDDFSPRQKNWRWYDDENNETPTAALAPENAAPTNIANQNAIKLRLTIKETAGVNSANQKFKLQFSEFSDFSQDIDNVAEIGNCAPNSLWCYSSGGGADNTLITTKLLTTSDNCSGGVGGGCGTHNQSGTSTSSFALLGNAASEYEFTIKNSGGAQNTVYFFRAFDVIRNKAVPLYFGATFPSLSVEGATLTFDFSGLPSGTATGGVITNATTTPTQIAFSNLEFNVETAAAHRLTVLSGANYGYKIFMFQTEGLMNDSGDEIAPITGTNENPVSWSVGCAANASGCYGYHTTDGLLEGDSLRFGPNDTYAKLETAPKEIAFSGNSAPNEITDVIFKVKITNEQTPGDYKSSIIYIVVPVF